VVEPEIALVFSADPWVEALHRHCSDHGGARLRQLLVDPVLALDEDYTTLVTGHRWPALTPALVEDLHRHGRSVLGIWDRAEPESRALLVSVGVDALVASDASPREIVDAITAIPGAAEAKPEVADDPLEARGGRRIVVGGPAGTGSTEIAIGLAGALNERGRRSVLVDVDDVAPAIASRLGLALEPNICTAVDAVEFRSGVLGDAVSRVGDFDVVAGFPAPSSFSRLRPPEVLRVVHALASEYERVIIDIAVPTRSESTFADTAAPGLAKALLADADVLVGVAAPTPVGVARFVAWLASVLPFAPEAELHIVVNRAPSSAFRRGEIQSELLAAVRPQTLVFVPADRRVEDAAWSGELVRRGSFARAIKDVASGLFRSERPSFETGVRPAPKRRMAS
jgi:MinD-like ATPase involved in chromosome partitioning or flagellar assembly